MIYLEVLKEAPPLCEFLDPMISERFDAAASRVSVETLGHRAGDTLAVLCGKIVQMKDIF